MLNFYSFSSFLPFDGLLCVQAVGKFPVMVRSSTSNRQPPTSSASLPPPTQTGTDRPSPHTHPPPFPGGTAGPIRRVHPTFLSHFPVPQFPSTETNTEPHSQLISTQRHISGTRHLEADQASHTLGGGAPLPKTHQVWRVVQTCSAPSANVSRNNLREGKNEAECPIYKW